MSTNIKNPKSVEEYIKSLDDILEKFKNTDQRFIGTDGRLIFFDGRTWYAINLPNYPGNPYNKKKILENLEKDRRQLDMNLMEFAFTPEKAAKEAKDIAAVKLATDKFLKVVQNYRNYSIGGLDVEKREGDANIVPISEEMRDLLAPEM